MKDIVVIERFTFPPNMRKYVANHLGKENATHADIVALMHALVDVWEQDLMSDYYAKQAELEG